MSHIRQRAITGIGYTTLAKVITTTIGFIRTLLLLKLLHPDDFGSVTFALFFASLIGAVTQFSLHHAFIHGASENEDEFAASVMTVDITLATGRLGLAILLSPLLAWLYPEYPLLPLLLIIFFAAYIPGAAAAAPLAVLERRMAYRRIATINVVSSFVITTMTIGLAWLGFGIWALVLEVVLMRLLLFAGLYAYKPPWKPRLRFKTDFIRRYSRFSLAISGSNLLAFLTDRFDDYWTGDFLGKTSLGYYSRAYELAGYPRRIIASPVIKVAFPTFSHLRHDKNTLSQAFVRYLAFLIRAGFWVALTLFLTAPEFIALLGDKWLPMLTTFRIMVIYTLVDPLTGLLSVLFIALGRPIITTKTRVIQLILFVPGVAALGHFYGIEGVAVAADIMIMTGFIILLLKARQHVVFSVRYLFAAPGLAFVTAVSITSYLSLYLPSGNLFLFFLSKVLLSSAIFLLILFLLERQMYTPYIPFVVEHLRAFKLKR